MTPTPLPARPLFAAVEDQFDAEEVDPLALKGFSRPTTVQNVLGSKPRPAADG